MRALSAIPFCPYDGWRVSLGDLSAGLRYTTLETLGTLFHGKRTSVDLIVRVIACLAEGLGIRGTARVFEVDPNTVLHWLGASAAAPPHMWKEQGQPAPGLLC